ncbi:TetR/AcrR family transcriptional regulator [Vibrio sp. SCSIO 43137]|uniref:TetR/AcrR family transcriptional regulator n=1 Tax=Vibrio sp. SCSIO 43137 TaxID=3021011 RepID=UPI00230791E7|nr:TetR/AcrR family transcriptional regulator [Vibrio sp. SCSIO 43137]WCE31765.1 TetR/AcrR family transcriptional regulator [Vibrio sp. SCSIO 43137]
MPRPSLKAERTEAILDAVERVVIRDGISGVTLEKIAEEAGMRRTLLRHNIGNREQLIEAFLDRFFVKSDHQTQQMLDYLPEENRVTVLLDLLFDAEYANNQLTLVALAVTFAATSDTNIQHRMQHWNANFIKTISGQLRLSFKGASEKACHEVATGLTGIYCNCESLAPLGDISEIRTASKRAAKRLVSTLEKCDEQ